MLEKRKSPQADDGYEDQGRSWEAEPRPCGVTLDGIDTQLGKLQCSQRGVRDLVSPTVVSL